MTDQVVVETGLVDEGLPAMSITTAQSTWWYQTEAGGFSSLVDSSGADWIGWNMAAGSAGEYRGLPNLVYPAGYFHPGSTGHVTTLDADGPLRSSLTTVSPDGQWEIRWDVYPSHAVATVLVADTPYWFLYEGTPGGSVEATSDFWAQSSGTTDTLDNSFDADMAAPEWVQFGDPVAGRSLFLINHTDDVAPDSFRTMNNAMTVFGFGRSGLSRSLTGTGREFSVGLLDTADPTAASGVIGGLESEPAVVVGAGHTDISDTTPPVITSGPLATPGAEAIEVVWDTDEASTSEVAVGLTTALEFGTFTAPGYTTAHAVTVPGLECETGYYWAVTSMDGSGNAVSTAPTASQTTTCAPTSS